MTNREFKKNVREGWNLIPAHGPVCTGLSLLRNRAPSFRLSPALNWAGLALIVGLFLVIALTEGTSPFSLRLDSIGPDEIYSPFVDILS